MKGSACRLGRMDDWDRSEWMRAVRVMWNCVGLAVLASVAVLSAIVVVLLVTVGRGIGLGDAA